MTPRCKRDAALAARMDQAALAAWRAKLAAQKAACEARKGERTS